MCEPTLIAAATFALGATEAVSSYVGQNQLHRQATQTANYNFAREQDALTRQDTQLQQERSEAALDTAIATARAQGAISASASDFGTAPSSLAHQLNASLFGIGRQVTLDDINFRNQRRELQERRTDAEIRRQNTIAAHPSASSASLLLGLGKAGLGAYKSYRAADGAGEK